ncbi:MAG: DNA polymerase IV [Solirubrobacterales bacterium]
MDTTGLTIIHCDLDAFFASVEQRDRPELRNLPVIVGGDLDSRGVVSTCSYEARRYGVHSAMPVKRAVLLCPDGIFLPVDMKRYEAAAREVFAILIEYTPVIERLSIDEAFLDISGCEKLFGDARTIGEAIRTRVRQETGLPVSVGISGNKFLAKLATELAKPDGLRVIRPEAADDVLGPLAVENLWGIGAKTKAHLNRMGIQTISDLKACSPETLRPVFGSQLDQMLRLAGGIDDRAVECERDAKSLGRETTFPVDVDHRGELERVLLGFAQEIGRRLRQSELTCRTVVLKLRFPDFQTISRSTTLGEPTAADMTIYQAATAQLARIPVQRGIRLIGIHVSGLSGTAAVEEQDLFNPESIDRADLDETLDRIRDRFGEQAITRAQTLRTPDHD